MSPYGGRAGLLILRAAHQRRRLIVGHGDGYRVYGLAYPVVVGVVHSLKV